MIRNKRSSIFTIDTKDKNRKNIIKKEKHGRS
jgi:hypothetical protein